jgi:hypothetical protein
MTVARCKGLALLWWACATLAAAAPADDHQRGLLAYHRGDVVGAMSALRPAAKAGHAPSQALLALILDRADFTEEAFALYRDAAAQDDAEGHMGVGNACLTGRGIAKDEKRALLHFSKAADLGHASAIEVVAEAHIKGQFDLASAPPDEALAAVRRAADRGHLISIEALAQAYRGGRWGLAADPGQASAWQAKATQLRAQRAAVKPVPPKASS